MLVVQPGSEAFQMAALLPMAAALCWAVSAIAIRMMSSERPEVTLAWTSLVGLGALSVVVPLDWRDPTLHEIGIAVLMSAFSLMGHWLIILAFRRAPASTLAPFSYVQLVSAGIFAFAAFGSIPGTWTFVGGAVIAASGLYVAHRERSPAPRRAQGKRALWRTVLVWRR